MDKIRKRLPEHKKGAKQGDRESQYWLGYCYYHGQGMKKDCRQASKYMKLAAEQGSGKAAYQLGFCYRNGLGVKKSSEKSKQWYQKAFEPLSQEADRNDFESVGLLGRAFLNGNGASQDIKRGVQLMKQAAEQGNTIGRNLLAECYFDGVGVEKNLERALALYKKSAEEGDPVAQNQIGNMYLHGQGVGQDGSKAIELFRIASKNYDSTSTCNIGWCYEHGAGVEKDLGMAEQFYKQAADEGNATALNNLGCLYHKNKNDSKKAFKLFLESSRRSNSAAAQENIGYFYEKGIGVKKNLRLAVKWYHKAMRAEKPSNGAYLDRLVGELKSKAHQQEKNVLKALAYCYRHGAGVQQQCPEMVDALSRQADASKERISNVTDALAKSCLCCNNRPPTSVLVHGGTGHACFCFPCALSCAAPAGSEETTTTTNKKKPCCPVCRAAIDKVVLLLPAGIGEKEKRAPKLYDVCISCGKRNQPGAVVIHGETGHSCCCYDCAQDAKTGDRGCPACREPIDSVVKRYC